MKLGNLLIIASLLIGTAAYAQDGEEDRECTRLRVVANNAMAIKNYKEATDYFQRADAYCEGGLKKDDYNRLISCIQNVMDINEGEVYLNYLDTLMAVYERTDEKGFYDQGDDIVRGYYYTQLRTPNYVKADKFLSRGMKNQGKDLTDPQYITLYYFNTYTMWYIEPDETAKGVLKQRLINDFFDMSKLIQEANYPPSIQEGLRGYLAQVITSCDDLLPEIPRFMETLPEDMESKKTVLWNMVNLMKSKGCQEADEYKQIIESMYALDPKDKEIQLLYLEILPCRDRIAIYKEIKANATDDAEKNAIQYKIAYCYLQLGSYSVAYGASQSISGEFRGEAYQIMATCVAKTANDCGVSTFDRKCNYIYAVQLLEKAQANGVGGLSGTIANYQAAAPNQNDCFDNGNPSSVYLDCWKVTVNPCN